MAEAKHKPLSFSTTMRNPVRIAWFLKCVQPYEGEILTNDIIYKIISNVIRNKLYFTVYEKKVYRLKNIFKSIDENFTDADIQEIISNSPQKHKEAGFDYLSICSCSIAEINSYPKGDISIFSHMEYHINQNSFCILYQVSNLEGRQ